MDNIIHQPKDRVAGTGKPRYTPYGSKLPERVPKERSYAKAYRRETGANREPISLPSAPARREDEGMFFRSLISRLLLVACSCSMGFGQMASHPRIWYNTISTQMLAHKAANDAAWLAIKARADAYLAANIWTYTITGASNANPTELTVLESFATNGFGIGSSVYLYFGGFTVAGWTTLNAAVPPANLTNHYQCVIDTIHTCHLAAINSTTWAPFGSQAPAVFPDYPTPSNAIYYSYEGSHWYDAAVVLSTVYKMTGTASYALKAIQLLDHINALAANNVYAPINLDSGFPFRFVPPAVAIIYDWCFDQLDFDSGGASRKAATVATVNQYYGWFSSGSNCTTGGGCPYANRSRAWSNYWGGYIFGMSLAAYAVYDENVRSAAILNDVNGEFDTYWTADWNSPGGNAAGGYPLEGWSYGSGHFTRILQYLLARSTATGATLLGSSYAQRMSTYLINDFMPTRWQTTALGQGVDSGLWGRSLLPVIATVIPTSNEGGWANWLYEHLGSPPAPCGISTSCYASNFAVQTPDTFLWVYPSSMGGPSVDYTATQLPYAAMNGTGDVFWRTGWTNNDNWMKFVGGNFNWTFSGHSCFAGGELNLTHGNDYLLMDACQWYGSFPYNGSNLNWVVQGKGGSTLFFDDGGSYVAGYPGGQVAAAPWKAPITKLTNSYAYAFSDQTAMYDRAVPIPTNRTVRYFMREVVALGGGLFVAHDRVLAKSTAYTKYLQWHFPLASTTLVGATATTNKGSSTMHTVTVLPAAPTLTLTTDNDTSGNAVTQVLQAKDSVTGTGLEGLTVFYMGASGVSLPTTAAITTDANHVGVQVADSTPKVAIFAAPVTDNGNNTYTPASYTSVSFNSTHGGTGNYLVAGLSPGTYAITGGSGGTVLVGSDGTAYFASTSGLISLAQSSAGNLAPSLCDLNSDGIVNAADVQIAVNRIVNQTSCTFDLDGNGRCDVVDLQRVINASAGGACKVGQ